MILYSAKCVAGVVSLMDGATPIVIPDCNILGAGTAPESTGIVIADQDRFWYIPLVTPNLKDIVDRIADIITQASSIVDVLKQSSTLLDNASVAAGPTTTWTPSVVTGTKMSTDAEAVGTKLTQLASEVEVLKQNIV